MIIENAVVNRFEDYLRIVCKYFSDNWKDVTEDSMNLQLVHGIPKNYPACVQVQESGTGYKIKIVNAEA